MTFISYAQNFEDVMLWRALKHVENGFYIDVGAHDPEAGSVTKAFYDREWNGINIEPIAKPFKALESARPRDINLQLCAGAWEGEIEMYDIAPSGLATVLPKLAADYRAAGHEVHTVTVPVRRLESICREFALGGIHFLKIDVEGSEKNVLTGTDFKRFRPWIVVVEATVPNSPEPSYQEWEPILVDANYKFVYFDGLNRFYVADEHPELIPSFSVPPNFFDGFALAPTSFFARLVYARTQQAEATVQAPSRIKGLPLLAASFVVSRPRLKRFALALLNRVPALKARLTKAVRGQGRLSQPPPLPYIKSATRLSKSAMRIYQDLRDALSVTTLNK